MENEATDRVQLNTPCWIKQVSPAENFHVKVIKKKLEHAVSMGVLVNDEYVAKVVMSQIKHIDTRVLSTMHQGAHHPGYIEKLLLGRMSVILWSVLHFRGNDAGI